MKSAGCLAERISEKIRDVDIVGPAPSPMEKLRGYYRWNVLIKTMDVSGTTGNLRKVLKGFRKGTGVLMAVDVDPMSM